jgi:hypothetical protein
VTSASLSVLAQTSAWLKLGHYRKTWLGGRLSEIDGPGFFLAEDGRTNPEHELARDFADLETFQHLRSNNPSTPINDTDPECRMPARFAFLKQNVIEAAAWRAPNCPRYAHFHDGIRATSATLVFSSYYLNNPASAFGHTFVRLNKEAHDGSRYPLLDYGVGYAADAGNANPLSFALGGLFGWFPGSFSNVPYYLKVAEYNDFETRDLWEYDLDLSKQEVELLVAHFWELAAARISYKYLSANCSSLLLGALEAAAPRLELSDKLPYWVIPADTVHALFELPGLVTSTHFRPSKRTQFVVRASLLSAQGRENVARVVDADDPAKAAAALSGPETARELDTLIDYFDFRHFKAIALGNEALAKTKQAILIERSRFLKAEALVIEAPEHERPERGHGSARAVTGVQTSQGDNSADGSLDPNRSGQRVLLGQRFALHGMLDSQVGFPRDSEIDFMDFAFSLTAASARLEHAYLFAVKSFSPYERLLPNWSWKVRIGAERTLDQSCNACSAGVAAFGGGYTLDLLDRHFVFATLLASGDASLGDFSRSKLKVKLGPELNLRAIFSPRVVLELNGFYSHIFLEEPLDAFEFREELRVATESRAYAVGFSASQLPRNTQELLLQAFFYY